ncbi:MAG TPA: YwqG family protein [Allosphingosinicella sp.]|nr:YwqG family protein [Allosphingosinicella sp.]
MFDTLVNAVPALRLAGSASGGSKIGGRPHLSGEVEWPVWKGRLQSFLAQINLEEVRLAGGPEWLPRDGTLFFFYDSEQETWGFSPEDRGSWAVIYDPLPPPTQRREREPAPAPVEFVEQIVGMSIQTSLPSPERLGIDTSALADEEWCHFDEAMEKLDCDHPCHQIGGWPRPVQNDDMELECQLASNGVYCGDASGYGSDAARELAPGASEWRLLLQLDSDDDSGMMWGDLGTLYFWVRQQDARSGDFSNVWMVLQCS